MVEDGGESAAGPHVPQEDVAVGVGGGDQPARVLLGRGWRGERLSRLVKIAGKEDKKPCMHAWTRRVLAGLQIPAKNKICILNRDARGRVRKRDCRK